MSNEARELAKCRNRRLRLKSFSNRQSAKKSCSCVLSYTVTSFTLETFLQNAFFYTQESRTEVIWSTVTKWLEIGAGQRARKCTFFGLAIARLVENCENVSPSNVSTELSVWRAKYRSTEMNIIHSIWKSFSYF